MKSLLRKNLEEAIAERMTYYGTLFDNLQVINKEIAGQQALKNHTLDLMKSTLDDLSTIQKTFPSLDVPIMPLPPELQFPLGVNTKIGDAIESILKRNGSMRRPALLKLLQVSGIPINPNAPHTVIANAIKRDTKKRFKILKDGRVALQRLEKRADAKG